MSRILVCFALASVMLVSEAVASIVFVTSPGETVPDNGVNRPVSARAELSIDKNGDLQIILTNTSLLNDQGNITRLTNFEFDLTQSAKDRGVLLGLGGNAKVLVNTGSAIVKQPSGLTIVDGNISGGWVFGENVAPDGFPAMSFDYGVSATSFDAGQIARFDGSTDFGANHAFGPVNGGGWGLIGVSSTYDYQGPSVRSSVVITLDVLSKNVAALDLGDIAGVVFTYGSEMEGVVGMVQGEPSQGVVPEPASLLLWGMFGLGSLGYGVVRRRRR